MEPEATGYVSACLLQSVIPVGPLHSLLVWLSWPAYLAVPGSYYVSNHHASQRLFHWSLG